MEHVGFTIWFTGVPAAGKSTIGHAVEQRLRELGLLVENLDSDEVRAIISPKLGWSLEARDENTKRLAYMGHILSRNRIAVIIAAVASLRRFRDRAREMIPNFVEVYVKCPLEVCMARDPKGLYARAARGEINDVAGLHQPYEEPLAPELILETNRHTVDECVEQVLATLAELEYVPAARLGKAAAS